MSTPDCTQLSLFDYKPSKRCTKCNVELPLDTEHWHRKTQSRDGFSPWCIQCTLAIARGYYLNNREARIEATRIQRILHPEQRRKWDKSRRDRLGAKLNAYLQQWKRDHPEQAKAIGRNYRQTHPEQGRKDCENRRARVNNAEGYYGVQDILNLYEWQDGRCIYCGIPIFPDIPRDMHIDHVLPLSRGGTNWPDNLVLACITCNDSKGTKTIAEWQRVRGW